MKRDVRSLARDAADAPALMAFMAGLYLAAFYITNNLTMLSGSSVLALVLIFTVPVTLGVALMNVLMRMFGKASLGRALSVFVCVVYLLVAMRGTVFDNELLRHLYPDGIVKIFSFAVPAVLLTLLFRNHIGMLIIVLGVMTITSFAVSVPSALSRLSYDGEEFGSEMGRKLSGAKLSQTPNVYFILSDSYSSFAYLKANGIDVGDFRSHLSNAGFRLYDDVFSNYQATADAMPAMLNMDHHYYKMSLKSSEVMTAGRVIAGGKNNVVRVLRQNGYQIQYIHHGPYLLLKGCSADICFGSDRFAGARIVLHKILPDGLQGPKWNMKSADAVAREFQRLLGTDLPPGASRFQYIHLYSPWHAPNNQIGVCDRVEEIERYSRRIAFINDYLTAMVDRIVSRDPSAVIVLAGDHGPFIENNCERWPDIGTVAEYRDRAGVLMAIRWPSNYDGRYDDRIKTTINMFRYVLASLADDESEFLSTVVADDVYVMGSEDILKVIEGGKALATAQHIRKID